MFCIVMNRSADLLSWWFCKEWRIEVKLRESNLSGTAALLLWDWGKGCGFLAVKGWRDLRWTVARFCGNVAPFAAGPTTDNDYSPTKQSVGSFNTKLFNIVYLWSPKISRHMFENLKQERASWCQISRWSGYKGRKGHLPHDGSPKECGKDSIAIAPYKMFIDWPIFG